jgi:hypothetical protein
MDQLILRRNRETKHFDEVEWTMLGWQDRRVLDDTGTQGGASNSNTVIGFVYVGVLVLFMLAYLT